MTWLECSGVFLHFLNLHFPLDPSLDVSILDVGKGDLEHGEGGLEHEQGSLGHG